MRTAVVPHRNARGKITGLLQRVWAILKPTDRVQHDEFRFFKRHRCTPLAAAEKQAALVTARRQHQVEVEKHNEILNRQAAVDGYNNEMRRVYAGVTQEVAA